MLNPVLRSSGTHSNGRIFDFLNSFSFLDFGVITHGDLKVAGLSSLLLLWWEENNSSSTEDLLLIVLYPDFGRSLRCAEGGRSVLWVEGGRSVLWVEGGRIDTTEGGRLPINSKSSIFSSYWSTLTVPWSETNNNKIITNIAELYIKTLCTH